MILSHSSSSAWRQHALDCDAGVLQAKSGVQILFSLDQSLNILILETSHRRQAAVPLARAQEPPFLSRSVDFAHQTAPS